MDDSARSELKRTPLYPLHVENGARLVPFAGYEMPVQYAAGVLKEHLHTRAAAGLFDVSHMGQIVLRPKSGRLADAALALERLVPVDVAGLAFGRQHYGVFTNDSGGILDDLMIANCGDHLLLIVNAACKDADERHLRAHLSDVCDIEVQDRALIALQGPKAGDVLARHAPLCAEMAFMDVRQLNILGTECVVIRSGYTGEDGFEISIPAQRASNIAAALLQDADVELIGLGARDSLRLEAGLCLYGSDIDETTTPIEAGIGWVVQSARRAGGSRAAGFAGSEVIQKQIAEGVARRRVGLIGEGRAPVRGGAPIFADEIAADRIGVVTSGGFGPSYDGPISMGYLPTSKSELGTKVFAEVRGRRLPLTVAPLPFVPARFKRGARRQP